MAARIREYRVNNNNTARIVVVDDETGNEIEFTVPIEDTENVRSVFNKIATEYQRLATMPNRNPARFVGRLIPNG